MIEDFMVLRVSMFSEIYKDLCATDSIYGMDK